MQSAATQLLDWFWVCGLEDHALAACLQFDIRKKRRIWLICCGIIRKKKDEERER